MNIGRIFAHAFVRRVAYVFAALLLAYIGIGKAHAQSDNHPTQSEANSHCDSVVSGNVNAWCASQSPGNYEPRSVVDVKCEANVGNMYYEEQGRCMGKNGAIEIQVASYTSGTNAFHMWATSCPAGTAPDPTDGYTCRSPGEICQARNEDLGDALVPRTWTSKCIAGCTLGMKPGYSTTNVAGGDTIYRGQLEYSGASCGAVVPPGPETTPDVDQDRQECVPIAGQTACVKPDGKICASASTGKQFCWAPGETGFKSDQGVGQVRGPGATTPTLPPPPPGETYNDVKPPITTTTSTPGTTTIVTTTVTGTTTNGTNPGTRNDGEPSDGSGLGEEEGQGNSASGGEGCAAPPVCGPDAAAADCQLLVQTWRTRCTGTLSGSGDCGVDGQGGTPYTCTGDPLTKVACEMLAQQRTEKCARIAHNAKLVSDGDVSGIDQTMPALWNDGQQGVQLDGSLLSMGGAGGDLLPTINLEGQVWSVPQQFYDLLDAIKMLVIFAFGIYATRIAGGQ